MGSAPGVMHVLTPSIACPQSIPCFPTRVVPESRAQSLGIIEPNLFNQMDREEACASEGNQPSTEQSPLYPNPAQALENQSQMKAFLWGLGAAGAPLTKPDQKNATECLNDRLTLLLSESSLSNSEWILVVLVQLRNSCLRWRERQDYTIQVILRVKSTVQLLHPLGGGYRIKM